MQIQSSANIHLAETIIAGAKQAFGDGSYSYNYAKEFCTEDFREDPIAYLFGKLIDRGVGRCCLDDAPRSYIISQVAGFRDQFRSLDYWRSFAVKYYAGCPNKEKIMEVFERSLENSEFRRDWQEAIESLDRKDPYMAEDNARVPLTVYMQAKRLGEYSHPVERAMERAQVNF